MNSKKLILRKISLSFFLIASTIIIFLHSKITYFPSVDSICPFGGLETIYKFLLTGNFISKISIGNIVLLGLTLFFGIFLGRIFCGWICSFGAIQEGAHWVGYKIFRKKLVINEKIDKYLRLIKYPLLFIILYFTYKTATLIIRPFDPWATYGHIFSGIEEVLTDFTGGFIVLVSTIIGSLFIERFFCKYVCPLGAFLGIIRILNINKITRDKSSCISCKMCNKICSMNIDIMNKEKVKSAECINCFDCIEVCPTKKDTLKLKTFNIKINPMFAGLLIIISFILIYVLGTFLPIKGLTFPIIKEKIQIINEENKDTQTIFNVPVGFEIKGSMTISDIAKALNITPEETKKLLGIPEDAPIDKQLKEFLELYGLSVKQIKEKLRK